MMLIWMFITLPILCVFTIILFRSWVKHRSKQLFPYLSNGSVITVGFFHPYCNAGGGGERVLWTAIQALQHKYENIRCVVYTGDVNYTSQEILDKAKKRFNMVLPKPVDFVFMKNRNWLEASNYPYFTLLGQSLGSIYLGFEALAKFLPDIYIDSMGYAFTLPLFKYIGGCFVGCYVHYPTISTDMLERVSERIQSYNNASFISHSLVLSSAKLLYYRLFAFIYGIVGRCSMVIMVNSSWTYGHITTLWKAKDRTAIVYPPCDLAEFLNIPLERPSRPRIVVSIAQFRPEKDHFLQIKSFHKFLSQLTDKERSQYSLLLVGSCRDDADINRVKSLRNICQDLNIEDYVEFRLNVLFKELKEILSLAEIGLHTMWNEHFGIGVVECMAAGAITLAHDSGGPKMDIVVSSKDCCTGFLASDVDSFARAFQVIFKLTPAEKREIQENARKHIQKFSKSEFDQRFVDAVEPIVLRCLKRKEL